MSVTAAPGSLLFEHHAPPFEEVGVLPAQSVGELASMLRSSSPLQARSFAVAMHERSCADGDWEQVDFWSGILDHL